MREKRRNNDQEKQHTNWNSPEFVVKSSQCMFNHIQKPPHFYNWPQFVWKYISRSNGTQYTATQNKKYDFCLRMMIVIMTSCYCIHRHTTILRTIYIFSCCHYSFFIYSHFLLFSSFMFNFAIIWLQINFNNLFSQCADTNGIITKQHSYSYNDIQYTWAISSKNSAEKKVEIWITFLFEFLSFSAFDSLVKWIFQERIWYDHTQSKLIITWTKTHGGCLILPLSHQITGKQNKCVCANASICLKLFPLQHLYINSYVCMTIFEKTINEEATTTKNCTFSNLNLYNLA